MKGKSQKKTQREAAFRKPAPRARRASAAGAAAALARASSTPPGTPARQRRQGKLSAEGFRFAVVVSRFNQAITDRLLQGALDALARLGSDESAIEVIEVPGAFEIPAAALLAAQGGRVHAVICLGLILRGDTPHFEFIGREVARGVGQSALESGVPHSFGVLTCNRLEEAVQRSGLKAGNKGWEAAMAAVEMAQLFAGLKNDLQLGG